MTNSTEKVSPKHVFLHLFVIITLYVATINFVTLLFQYINVWVADPLSEINYYSATQYFDIIRFALSSFLIVFLVFILTSWFLNKSYLKNPAVRDMKIRKWLIYFTVFVAALVIIGSLVRIIFVFLEGEITLRFILKVLSVLFITAIIFSYYLRDVRSEKSSPYHKYFVWAIIAVALITIVAGFFAIGSPKNQRLRRFDQERVDNLQSIQRQVVNYWRKKEFLPEKLTDLNDEIGGYNVPVDPETNESYGYNIKGDESFELCAVFNLPSDSLELKNSAQSSRPLTINKGRDWNWEHTSGNVCFERTIDDELYPPFDNVRLQEYPLD